VVCRARGVEPVSLADACLRGGARRLQVRAGKEESSGAIIRLTERIVAAAHDAGAEVIVNDRVDVALLAGADGVHVGQTDLPVAAARDVLGPGAIVGLSTHDRSQVDRAIESAASYLAVGPIFSTETKDTGYTARGLELVAYAAGRGMPVVAIGGITLERAPAVAAAGASWLAVISDIFVGGDPEARVRAFVAALPP
jgi:thiamine-phosphate pyrophosphorylase